MSNYDLRGANIVGAIGDHASASRFDQTQCVLRIGDQDFDKFRLVSEMDSLRAVIERGNATHSDSFSEEAQDALSEAETAARAGNEEGVRSNLAKLGKWVLRLAETTGAAVAAAAIRHAIGL